MKQLIIPSLICKNQRELGEDFKKLRGIKILHLDIVDGKFTHNKTFQFNFKLSKNHQYMAHLMMKEPFAFIKKYSSKIDLFIPQVEVIKDLENYILWMKSKKKKAALALKPETSINRLKPYLKRIDYILILTVHPGFYGSKFLSAPLKKIKLIKKINPKIKVIVDGGMNLQTIKLARREGADYFISGSYTTKAEKPKERIKELEKVFRNL